MSKIADLYIRVSTDEQAERGYSQRHQEEVMQKYCDLNNIKVRQVFFEDHSAKTFERPIWKQMLAGYKKQKGVINTILVLKWDRFSRNAADSYAMLLTLAKLGIQVQAIEQPLDLQIPENRIMLAFYLSAPEAENARRSLNTIAGMRRACKEGRHMGGAPLGYVNKITENGRKYIAPNYPEADIVKWAFKELASGQWSVLELWKQGREKGLRCGKNNFWLIIQNPVYCGKILVSQYQQEEAYYVTGTHEPLISEELFYQAQDVLFGRKRITAVKQTVREEFPLRNFLVCPKCGRMVSASSSKGRTKYYSYYHCISTCGWRFKTEIVNEAFVHELRKYKLSQAMASLYTEVFLEAYQQQFGDAQAHKKQILHEISLINARVSKARELLLADALSPQEYKDIKTECERKVILLEAKLSADTPKEADVEEIIRKALRNLSNLDERFTSADIQGKRQIIGSIFPEKLQFSENGFRTAKVNEAVQLIYNLGVAFEGIKKGQSSDKTTLSRKVPRTGLEPAHPCRRCDLNTVRLPISPPGHH